MIHLTFFQLTQDLQMKQNEISREARKKDKAEREINSHKKELENKTNEIKNLHSQLQRGKDDYSRLELQLKEQRVRYYCNFKLLSLLKNYFHLNVDVDKKISNICIVVYKNKAFLSQKLGY